MCYNTSMKGDSKMTYKDIIREELVERYGGKISNRLMSKLEYTYFNDNEYDYADNLRIARAGNEEEVKEYVKDHNNGCCGYYDDVLVIENDVFLMGFNYGH